MSSVAIHPFSLVFLFVAGMIFGVFAAFKLVRVLVATSPSIAAEMMQTYSKTLGLGAWVRFSRHWASVECPKCGYTDVILPGELKDHDDGSHP